MFFVPPKRYFRMHTWQEWNAVRDSKKLPLQMRALAELSRAREGSGQGEEELNNRNNHSRKFSDSSFWMAL